MMTKASFTNEQWKHLCSLAQIGPVDKKLHKLVPAKETNNHARVCCLQSRKSAPGCKEEHSSDIQLVDDMTQGDIFDQLSISLDVIPMSIPLTSDIRPTPASLLADNRHGRGDAAEPQPTEGGKAFNPEVRASTPHKAGTSLPMAGSGQPDLRSRTLPRQSSLSSSTYGPLTSRFGPRGDKKQWSKLHTAGSSQQLRQQTVGTRPFISTFGPRVDKQQWLKQRPTAGSGQQLQQ